MNTGSQNRVPLSVRRQGARDERRRGILEAAEAAFSKHGYHKASLAGIAQSAGYAVGTLYLYFEDKADLYGSLVLEKMRRMVVELEKALTHGGSAAASLRAGVASQFAFHDANRTFFEIFLQQHQVQASPLHERHWRGMEKLKRRNLSVIEKCIARGQAEGEIRSGDPKLFAVVYLGVTLQIIRQRIRENDSGRLVELAGFAADCFLHGAAARTRSVPRSR